jgi:hypothetical protein
VSEETGLKCIIPALTPVPVKRVQTHAITSEQSDITVELYEADGDSCGAPLLFGKVIIVIVRLVFCSVLVRTCHWRHEWGTGENYTMGRFKTSVFHMLSGQLNQEGWDGGTRNAYIILADNS